MDIGTGTDRSHGTDPAVGPRPGGHGWLEARRSAHAAAAPLDAHLVSLAAAAGLTTADVVTARVAVPAFDTAAMDGFAVAGTGPHRIVGRVLAGDTGAVVIAAGEAVEIATGALVPVGADAVVPVESARVRDGRVTAPAPSRVHIRRTGEDARAGDLLAPAGTRVGPALLGLAASCGYDDLLVRPRPRVRVLVTGDELRGCGPSGGGRVRDAFGPMIAPLVWGLGGDVVAVQRIADHPPARLAEALVAADPTVAVTVVTGSTSVGATDRLRPLLRERSARFVVDHVACRPGHPQLLAGTADGHWVIGLPGNPFAGLVAALTLLGPLLAGLSGRRLPALPHAVVIGDVRPLPHATRLLPVVWDGDHVQTLDGHGSAFLRGAALADAVAAVPPGWEPGVAVPLVPLPPAG